ncbi:polymorphic toxin-type HINT domain-containing protein, partial [Streptomyces sp. BF23-30]
MYLHVKQKIVTLLTVLCLTVAAGGTAAATEPPPESESTLLEIAARVAQYSKCRELPLLERPKCAKEFAIKSVKIGLGVGTFLYVFRESMEDGGASFAELEKEVEALKKLEPLIVMDPHTDAESDPRKKLEVLKQFVKTYQAARPNLDKLRTKLVMVARATGPQADSAVLLAALTASTYFPAGTPQPEVVASGEFGKWIDDVLGALDQANRGMDQMNEALDEMNGIMVDVNQSIDGINQGLTQANRGMTKLNAGLGQMNEGLKGTNTAVSGFTKAAEQILVAPNFIDFNFDHIAPRLGLNQVPPEVLAEQERKMGMLLNLLPGVGNGKGIIEAITGKDMTTGEKVSGIDRALGGLVVLRWIKVGGKLVPEVIRKARKGAKTCDSFPAGTPVLMGDGATRPIERIEIGDTVLATDPASGTTGPRRVEATIYTPDDRDFTSITLRPQDGRGSLTATDHHPFWAETRKQWTDAADLNTGDTLRTPDGTTVEIEKVTRWKDLQPAYNLTVNDLHTYYVLAGTTPVLVHNASCGFIPGAVPDAAAINRGSLVKLKDKQLKEALEK